MAFNQASGSVGGMPAERSPWSENSRPAKVENGVSYAGERVTAWGFLYMFPVRRRRSPCLLVCLHLHNCCRRQTPPPPNAAA